MILFNRIVGRFPIFPIEIPLTSVEFPKKTSKELFEIAQQYHPAFLQKKENKNFHTEQMNISRADYFPTLDFEVIASDRGDLNGIPGENKVLNGLFTLEWNLLTSGRRGAQMRSDRAAYNQAFHEEEYIKQQTQSNINKHIKIIKMSEHRFQKLKKYREELLQLLEVNKKEYKAGIISIINLIHSENEYHKAQEDEVNLLTSIIVDHFRLYHSAGVLLETISNQSINEK